MRIFVMLECFCTLTVVVVTQIFYVGANHIELHTHEHTLVHVKIGKNRVSAVV